MQKRLVILVVVVLALTLLPANAQLAASLQIFNVGGGQCSGTPPTSVSVSYSLSYDLPAGQLYRNVENTGGTFSIGPLGVDQSFSGPWDSGPRTLAADSTWRKTHYIHFGGTPDTGVEVTTYIDYDCAGLSDGDPARVTVSTPGDEEPVADVEDVAGCDVLVNIPDSAVGAAITTDTPVYWKPGEVSNEVFPAGLTLRAIGVDESGMYTQVLYVCGFYWVPTSAIGPNYNAPWNGAPLPTVVVD
jgi:hypothetical protein